MAKIVVTGAGGFIGGHVVVSLLKQGHSVIGVVRKMKPEYKEAVRGCDWVEWDFMKSRVPAGLMKVEPDLVYHAATANDIISSNVEDGYGLTVFGTNRIFDWAEARGAKDFVFLSTFQVYGQELNGGLDERSALDCQNHYALNHFFGERLLQLRAKESRTRVLVLRPSNVYGLPWCNEVNRWSLVPFCFCQSAFFKGAIELRSSGRQRRNFVHLDQLVKGAQIALRGVGSNYQVLNVASPHTYSMREIAELVGLESEKQLGRKIALTVLSDEPKNENDFEVEGSLWNNLSSGEGDFQGQQNQLENVVAELLVRLNEGRYNKKFENE